MLPETLTESTVCASPSTRRVKSLATAVWAAKFSLNRNVSDSPSASSEGWFGAAVRRVGGVQSLGVTEADAAEGWDGSSMLKAVAINV